MVPQESVLSIITSLPSLSASCVYHIRFFESISSCQNGLIRTHASMYRDKDVDKGFGPCVQLESSTLYIPNPLFPPIYQSRNNHLGEATKGQDNLYCLGSPRCCHDNVLEPLLGLNIGTQHRH
ncbi:hypothetical protein Bca4012_017465 [Brassica carinata]